MGEMGELAEMGESLTRIGKELEDTGNVTLEMQGEVLDLSERVKKLEDQTDDAEPPVRFVLTQASGCLHDIGCMKSTNPRMWSTRCGWKFGRSRLDYQLPVDAVHEDVQEPCKACLELWIQ